MNIVTLSPSQEGLGSLETFGEVSTGGVTTAVKEGGRGGSALERVVTATGCEVKKKGVDI